MRKINVTVIVLLSIIVSGGCSNDDSADSGGGGGGEPGVGVAYEIPPFEIMRHGIGLNDVWSNGEFTVCTGDDNKAFVITDARRFLLPIPADQAIMIMTVYSTGEGATYLGGRYADIHAEIPPLFRFENGLRYSETITSGNKVEGIHCASNLRSYAVSGTQLWCRVNDRWVIDHQFDSYCTGVFYAGSSRVYVTTKDGLHGYDGMTWSFIYPIDKCVGVEGIDEDQVLFVADDCIIMRNGGIDFDVAFAAGVDLHDVNWAAEDWAVAAGREGMVVMYDGINWSRLNIDFMGNLKAVYAWKTGDRNGAIVVGECGAEYTYADGDWSGSYLPVGKWQDIAGDGQGRLFGLYTADSPQRTILYEYDGTSWEDEPYPGDMILHTLFCVNDKALWALGQVDIDNFVAHYNGTNWSVSWLSSLETPRDLWVAGDQTVFVACDLGAVYVNGVPEVAIQPVQHLRGIWGVNAEDVFVVGENGTISRRQGYTWSTMNSGTAAHLNAVHGYSSSHVVAVGDGGAALQFDGASWTALDVGLDADLDEVWTNGGQDIWIASSSANKLAHFDGAAWTQIDVAPLGTASKSVWTDGQEVWVSSGRMLARYAEPPSFAALLGTR